MTTVVMLLVAPAIGCGGDGSGDGAVDGDVAGDGDDCGWQVELVDSAAGVSSSLAVDEAGDVHVGYSHDPARELHYARRAGDEWSIERIEGAGWTGFDLSLALDPAGSVHLAYGDGSSPAEIAVRYAIRAPSGAWAFLDPVGGSNDRYQSLALDAAGGSHVAVSSDSYHVNYVYRPPGGAWTAARVDDGGESALAIDAAGTVHVVYNQHESVGHAVLPVGGTWETTLFDTEVALGARPAIAIGPTGAVHIAYADRTNGTLKYAVNRGAWSIETLGLPGRPLAPSIAVDPAGVVHLLYHDGDGGGLHHAWAAEGGWTSSPVDPEGSQGKLVIDASGGIHASFTTPSRDLYYARPRCAL